MPNAERIEVTGLFVYPVKSCAGTPLMLAQLDARGIVHDREFLVVDPDATFLTQRELPRLALIRPTRTDTCLTLEAPGVSPIQLEPTLSGERMEVRIWRDRVASVDQGREVAEWLTSFLETPVRLVCQAEGAIRRVDPDYATSPDDQVAFPDGYPLLLISEESLADLNSRLQAPLPMNRFRPNVVVRNAPAAFAEDTWSRIAIGDVELSVVKSCARCIIPTTDQTTAKRGAEPLVTLTRYRHVPRGVLFGQNMIHHEQGVLRVAATVRVLATRAAPELVS